MHTRGNTTSCSNLNNTYPVTCTDTVQAGAVCGALSVTTLVWNFSGIVHTPSECDHVRCRDAQGLCSKPPGSARARTWNNNVRMRPLAHLCPLDCRVLSRKRPRALTLQQGNLFYSNAERLRKEARNLNDLHIAIRLFLAILLNVPSRARELRSRSRERLILLLCQRDDHDPLAAHLLRRGGFICRLSPAVLRYHESETSAPESPPPPELAHAVDSALAPGLLRALQTAFAPGSPFWSE